MSEYPNGANIHCSPSLLCLCHICICIVYIVKEVLLFSGLSKLMGMACNRTRARATDQQEESCFLLELIFLKFYKIL